MVLPAAGSLKALRPQAGSGDAGGGGSSGADGSSVLPDTGGLAATKAGTARRHVRETMAEFLAKKREIFLVQVGV